MTDSLPIWPESLPAAPLADSFRETVPNNTLRSEMDQGPAKTRPRSTAAVRLVSMAFLMDAAQAASFDAFYVETLAGGALSFSFTHPRTVQDITCRFRKPPEYAPLNGGFFRVVTEMEILP